MYISYIDMIYIKNFQNIVYYLLYDHFCTIIDYIVRILSRACVRNRLTF